MQHPPILMWFRRDLRLHDHEALSRAAAAGRPVIAVFILDEVTETLGAAAKMRLGLALDHFAGELAARGQRLILRRGKALPVLCELIAETGADSVFWSRLYDPVTRQRDTKLKSALQADGIRAESFGGHILFEPWQVKTKTGGFYKVYSPMWKNVRGIDVSSALPTPASIPAPDGFPPSDLLADWQMSKAMRRGAPTLASHCTVGERAAQDRLDRFVSERIGAYTKTRDIPGVNGTSGLSENLTYGEISSRVCWHAGWRALHDGKAAAETFLKELVWREFAYHLAFHTPHITTGNWRPEWDSFPWQADPSLPAVQAWQQGRTGIRFVDAAMREMYVTGTMHNRGRMIVASYLTKHLLCHWKIGSDWFADCLIDWDPCSNAMGWQWAAGSGPDAAPYFRVFNPVTQLEKFDGDGTYQHRWIAEAGSAPSATAMSYYDMIPLRWGMSPQDRYPDAIMPVDKGRQRALDAYAGQKN